VLRSFLLDAPGPEHKANTTRGRFRVRLAGRGHYQFLQTSLLATSSTVRTPLHHRLARALEQYDINLPAAFTLRQGQLFSALHPGANLPFRD